MSFDDWLAFIIVLLIGIFAFFGFMFFTLSQVMEHDKIIIETECYDKFENKINDVTCDKEIGCNYEWNFFNDRDCDDANLQGDEKNE